MLVTFMVYLDHIQYLRMIESARKCYFWAFYPFSAYGRPDRLSFRKVPGRTLDQITACQFLATGAKQGQILLQGGIAVVQRATSRQLFQ